jgi:helix-turn-helix protein
VSASAYYQRATGERSARRVEDERLLERIREVHEANYCAYGYRRTWKALERAGEKAPRCRVQRLMRAHGIQGAKRRGKPWRTTIPDPDAHQRPDLGQPGLHGVGTERAMGRGLLVSALLGGRGVLQLRDRRLQPHGRRLAVRSTCAPRLSSTRYGWRSRPGSVSRRSASYITATEAANTSAGTTRRRSPTTTCWRRSAAPAMPTTTAWPRASSTASRPRSSPTACGEHEASWSSRSSSTSPGSTTPASTKTSRIGHPREIEELYAVKSRALTENLLTPVSVNAGPAQALPAWPVPVVV